MSLHCIIEPAGTLQTGWKLSEKDPKKADIRNKDVATPTPQTRSKWELAEVR